MRHHVFHVGHAVPATFFIVSSLLFLILVVGRRLRSLEASRRNFKTYSELYMPEPNSSLLKWMGWITIGYGVLGAPLVLYSWRQGHGIEQISTHIAMYTSFPFAACVSILEGYRKLPPNAAVTALAFAFVLQGVLWREHGIMKKQQLAERTHTLQGYVSFACGALFAFSVLQNSLVAFVFGWATMLLNGIWMFTIALTRCCIELPIDHVAAYFVVESVFVAALVVVGAVFCLSGETNCAEYAYRMVLADNEEEEGREDDGPEITEKVPVARNPNLVSAGSPHSS